MNNWRTSTKSTVVRIAVSAPTFAAVAAVVGAGWKWI